MKKLFLISISMFFLFPMCQSQMSAKEIGASIHQAGISIEQNGKIIHPKNGVVTLEKSTFNFIIDFPDTMAIFVNASFDDNLYQLELEKSTVEKLDNILFDNLIYSKNDC